MPLYCARLFIVCLVGKTRARKRNTCDYPFVLIQATDSEHAFRRALELGKEQESEYLNDKGQPVRWAFVRVEEIKELSADLDGQEIGSLVDVWHSEKALPYNKRFQPSRFRPLLT
jgi:hypothetical protein